MKIIEKDPIDEEEVKAHYICAPYNSTKNIYCVLTREKNKNNTHNWHGIYTGGLGFCSALCIFYEDNDYQALGMVHGSGGLDANAVKYLVLAIQKKLVQADLKKAETCSVLIVEGSAGLGEYYTDRTKKGINKYLGSGVELKMIKNIDIVINFDKEYKIFAKNMCSAPSDHNYDHKKNAQGCWFEENDKNSVKCVS